MINICYAIYFLLQQGHTTPPQIEVSKETTVITSPLASDGLPDYEAYLLNEGFRRTTPENNAAIPLWEVLWPSELEPEELQPMCDALGLPNPPPKDLRLTLTHGESNIARIKNWLTAHYARKSGTELKALLGSEEFSEFLETAAYEIDAESQERPWRSADCPPLAKWVQENRKALDTLVAASRRPRFYSPPPQFLNDESDGLVGATLPMTQSVRNGVRALSARAMWHIGQGRFEEGWQDIFACYRLSKLMNQGWCLVQELVANALQEFAFDRTVVLLQCPNLRGELAHKILQELNNTPEWPTSFTGLNEGGRLSFVDMVLSLATGRNDAMNSRGEASNQKADWNFVLREGNRFYDRLATVVKISNRCERMKAINLINAELTNKATTSSKLWTRIEAIFSVQRRSELFSDILLSLTTPDMSALCAARDQIAAQLDMTRLAAALAVYRAEHGEYPAKLAALVPEIIPDMPMDLYSGQPLIYSRKDNGGYLLYSVFEYGVDDGGTQRDGEIIAGEWVDEPPEDFDGTASDLVIRVPVSAFKIPEPPVDETGQ